MGPADIMYVCIYIYVCVRACLCSRSRVLGNTTEKQGSEIISRSLLPL
jgi:hypothetical protein